MKLNKTLIFISLLAVISVGFSIQIKEKEAGKKNLGKESANNKTTETVKKQTPQVTHVTFDKGVEVEVIESKTDSINKKKTKLNNVVKRKQDSGENASAEDSVAQVDNNNNNNGQSNSDSNNNVNNPQSNSDSNNNANNAQPNNVSNNNANSRPNNNNTAPDAPLETDTVNPNAPATPPVPLNPKREVVHDQPVNPADNANTEITGVGEMGSPPKKVVLEPVSYVKELSPAGKASLELAESGDTEYQKLLNAGFESPTTTSQVVANKAVRVDRAARMDYDWMEKKPNDEGFWENVEYNRYNNRLLDTTRYITPAKFEKNMFGNIIVHAPSDSRMKITTPVHNLFTTQSTGFLSVDESQDEITEEELDAMTTEHP